MPIPKDWLMRFPKAAKSVILVSQAAMFAGVVTSSVLLIRLGSDGVQRPEQISLSSAEHWPEIKNGVPELVSSTRDSAQLPSASSTSPAPGSESTPDRVADGGTTDEPAIAGNAMAGSAPSVVGFTDAQQPRDLQVENQAPDAGTVTTSDNRGGDRERTVALETTPGTGTTGVPPNTAPRAPAVDVAKADTQPDHSADVAQAATRTAAEQPSGNTRQGLSRAPQSSTSNSHPSKTRAEINRAKAKAAKDEAARVAAVTQPEYPAGAMPSAGTPPPQEERTQVLGIPLPTGEEIQRCLLAFQC
jgi:hypothetical protein